MIIVNIMGGLGNQMFQYAAARRLAGIHDTILRIDTTNFDRLTPNKDHNVQLDCFNIKALQAHRDEIGHFKSNPFRRFLRKISKAPIPLTYEEPSNSAFKPDFLEIGPDAYLIGHFNSYKYSQPIRDLLVTEFQPLSTSPQADAILKKIDDTNSVSIHIRRGDYVTDPEVQKGIAGIITDRYYRNAIDLMMSRVAAPHFFVFSNDMPWVIENFKIPAPVTYVDFNTPSRGFEDLWIMSRCKHNITAGGSTFSWWAAYLNQNKDKIVVRTEKISNEENYNHPEDYFPPEWVIAAS